MIHPKRVHSVTFILLGFGLLAGACHSYYKVNRTKTGTPHETANSIDSLLQKERYFILRNGSTAWAITNYSLSPDRTVLNCRLESLPPSHMLHLMGGIKRKEQYRPNDPNNRHVVQEVHFFILPDTTAREGSYALALERVQRLEVIEHDKKRTTNSYVIGALGYTLGAAVLVAVIVAATKSSCPFVSAFLDGEFTLQGEIYGGAIYPQLARHDFMPLRMSPRADGTLQLKISNELKERQYTDIAQLRVITHDTSASIWVDQEGNIYAVSNPQAPTSVALNGRKSVAQSISRSSDYRLLYMDDSSSADAQNELVITFNNKTKASKGKLLLTLKNSYWLDYLYGELAKGFGDYYAIYMEEQRTKPAAELLKWTREQKIPLLIAMRKDGVWKEITSLNTIGPLAMRDVIIPLDMLDPGEETVEIRLSAGFMFWEIDYAALDFTPDAALSVEELLPREATDEKGNSVLASLLQEDGLFLEQPEIGNTATITYKANPFRDKAKRQTYILHTRGYYEHIRDFKNKPDLLFLSQFKKPNAFPRYGLRIYQQMKEQQLHSLTAKNATVNK